jgi:hypothetical protein
MKRPILFSTAALTLIAAAFAQTDTGPAADAPPQATTPPQTTAPLPAALPQAPAEIPPETPQTEAPSGPPKNAVLEIRALDKITGKAIIMLAPLGKPVHFATLTITARTCYSTPPSETPETSAFLQIDDHRPDQPQRRVFSGWMYASSPGINSMQHPIYDVWVISCMTNAPGQQPPVAAAAPVKPVSPNAGADEALPALPEDAGQ